MPTNSNTRRFVVDASVAVKWFSLEAESRAARVLLKRGELGEIRLFAPDLLLYEAGNALGKGKGLGAQDITEALETLLSSSIEFLRLNRKIVKYAADFMETYGLTFYDASYAALSYELEAPLISANPKDHKKVREITVKTLKQLI